MLNFIWFLLGVLYSVGMVCMCCGLPMGNEFDFWSKYHEFKRPGYSHDLYSGHKMARAFVGPSPPVIAFILNLPPDSPDGPLILRELVSNRCSLDYGRSYNCVDT